MTDDAKPRRAQVKLTRTVTVSEIAFVTLDRDGCVEELDEICESEELDTDNIEVHEILSVLSVHP